MGVRRHCDLEVRGRVFATAQEAARTLGVREETVMLAARRGRLDTLGLGRAAQRPTPMPVLIAGDPYPSCTIAAEALGVSRSAIWRAVDEGRADRFGGPPLYHKRQGSPVTICGRRFSSIKAAAEVLGLSRSWLRRLVLRSDTRARERLLAAVMAAETRDARTAA